MHISNYLTFESKDQLFSWLSKLATSSQISECKYNGVVEDYTNKETRGHILDFIFDKETCQEGLRKLEIARQLLQREKYWAMRYIWDLSFDSIFIPLQNIHDEVKSDDFDYICNKIAR